jgi:hypothetical protein
MADRADALVVHAAARHAGLTRVIVVSFLINLVLFLMPAAPFAWLASRMSKTSRDEWQLLVWVPVLPLGIWGVIVAFAVTRDRTSHNLWPFEAVIWGALSAAVLAVVAITRRFAMRADKARHPFHGNRRPPTTP